MMLLPNSITQSFPLNHITKLSFNNQRPTILHNAFINVKERRSMLSSKNIQERIVIFYKICFTPAEQNIVLFLIFIANQCY